VKGRVVFEGNSQRLLEQRDEVESHLGV